MTDPTTDVHVAEARRNVHEALVLLPAWEADRVRSLIADLESAVESRTAVRMADAASAVSLPPADQTALRDRIAAAMREHGMVHLGDQVPADEYECCADAVLAVLPATPDRAEYDALVADADRLRRDGAALHAKAVDLDTQLAALREQVAAPVAPRETAEAVLAIVEAALGDTLVPAARAEALAGIAAVLPATADQTADRAALREAADRAEIVALRLRLKHDYGAANGAREVVDSLRRMADEAPATETAHQPHRGDQFEAWLKTQRDAAADHPEAYQAADGLLDLYRLHADMGVPLDGHVCEARVVGDCECLEQPAVGCGECGHPKAAHGEGDDPVTPGQCADCPDDDAWHDFQSAVGARQDGAQQS